MQHRKSNILFSLTCIFLGWLVIPISGFAARTDPNAGWGGLANNLMQPVTLMGDFLQGGCMLLGCGFLFASIVKYFDHRRSPLMVSLGTVIFLLVAGLVLVGLSLISYVASSGIISNLF